MMQEPRHHDAAAESTPQHDDANGVANTAHETTDNDAGHETASQPPEQPERSSQTGQSNHYPEQQNCSAEERRNRPEQQRCTQRHRQSHHQPLKTRHRALSNLLFQIHIALPQAA